MHDGAHGHGSMLTEHNLAEQQRHLGPRFASEGEARTAAQYAAADWARRPSIAPPSFISRPEPVEPPAPEPTIPFGGGVDIVRIGTQRQLLQQQNTPAFDEEAAMLAAAKEQLRQRYRAEREAHFRRKAQKAFDDDDGAFDDVAWEYSRLAAHAQASRLNVLDGAGGFQRAGSPKTNRKKARGF